MDPIKVQGVTDWPQPMKVKDVQSFIGFVNFYQRFIWNFSKIACPLHALTQKLKDWSWGAAEQQAFNVLKNAITSAPMTSPSTDRKSTRLNSSHLGISYAVFCLKKKKTQV